MKPNITQKNRLTYDELRVMGIVEEYFRRHIYDRERIGSTRIERERVAEHK